MAKYLRSWCHPTVVGHSVAARPCALGLLNTAVLNSTASVEPSAACAAATYGFGALRNGKLNFEVGAYFHKII